MARKPANPHPFTALPWVGFADQGKIVAIMPAGRDGDICTFSKSPSDADARLMIAAPDLFEMALLLERSIEYQIRVATADGDDEGARLQSFTLHMVREVIAKVTGNYAKTRAA